MEIKTRKDNSTTFLNYAEMVQLMNDYNQEVDGKPRYRVRELCEKYKISEPTFHRYKRRMREKA